VDSEIIVSLPLNKIKMKKEDLKTGHRVTLRNRKEFVVMLGTHHGDLLAGFTTNGYIPLGEYTQDLSHHRSPTRDWDFASVAVCESGINYLHGNGRKLITLWERNKPIPEYTMEEAVKKMGHEFKIKK
jgi:hypothetical protein